MKRTKILLASALTLTAGIAAAGMGPTRGLPQGWTVNGARGYGVGNVVNGNGASAMCVECHTINPSALIYDVSDIGAATIDRTNTQYRGSHYVMNAQANNFLANQTNSGGGFVGGFGGAASNTGKYLRSGGWAATAWTGGGIAANAYSKFGYGATLTNVTTEGNAAANAGTAELICESCHNIIGNALGANDAGAADNDLLLGVYQDNVQDSICTGCHAGTEAAAGRNTFHGNDNLAPFAGPSAPTRKRHHVMSGDTLSNANYLNGTNSIMWAPSASDRLSATWCATPYSNAPGAITNLNLVAGEPIAYRGLCNVAGQGSRAAGVAATLGDVVDQGAAGFNCSNCHRPHNAMTNAGAFILRYGNAGGPDFVGNAGSGAFNGVTRDTAGVPGIAFGLRRQIDVDTNYAQKVYQDYRPLCAGCHYGY